MMSLTLEALWSLHPPVNQTVLAQSVEYVARGGRSRHFFFLGGGGGGSIFFLIALALVIAGGRYLMKNPDRARQLKDRFKGARGQQPGPFNPYHNPTVNPYQHPTAGLPDPAPPPYAPPNSPGTQALGPPAAWPPSQGPGSPYGSQAAANPSPLPPTTYVSAVGTNGSGRLPQSPPNTRGIPTVSSSHPPVGAMRFNPPPNWPVPPGWAPGPGRQPDPSWPPAPTGWRFWVPQDTQA